VSRSRLVFQTSGDLVEKPKQEIGQEDDVTRYDGVVVAAGAMRCRILEQSNRASEEVHRCFLLARVRCGVQQRSWSVNREGLLHQLHPEQRLWRVGKFSDADFNLTQRSEHGQVVLAQEELFLYLLRDALVQRNSPAARPL
jgi:hypothetical protein